MPFDNGVRPIGFETRADGSTNRMFVQISDFHGFYVVDFAARKEIGSASRCRSCRRRSRTGTRCRVRRRTASASRPMARRSGCAARSTHAVYAYSMPDLKLLGGVEVGHHPDWLTFSPDSKRVYVANAGSNSVSVVDVATRKELSQVPVGQVPKRNITAMTPVAAAAAAWRRDELRHVHADALQQRLEAGLVHGLRVGLVGRDELSWSRARSARR